MFINIRKPATRFLPLTYTLFDTDTGISYALSLNPEMNARDNKVSLDITSVHTGPDEGISYTGKEALSFWEMLSVHPNVKDESSLELWFTQAFNEADNLLTQDEEANPD